MKIKKETLKLAIKDVEKEVNELETILAERKTYLKELKKELGE